MVPTISIRSHAFTVVGLYATPMPKMDPEGDGETDPVGAGVTLPVGLGDMVEVSVGEGESEGVRLSVGVAVGLWL